MFTDPSTLIFLLIMPLLMVALMRQLRGRAGRRGVPRCERLGVRDPGMAVGFAAFGVSYAGFTFFRDHGWGTWDRLRAAPVTSVDLIAGKVVPTVSVTVAQLALLFVLGRPLFDFRVSGSIVAIGLIIVVLALSLSAFGMAMIGGAWVPVASMPGWAQAIAPTMRTYWAMKAFRSVILQGGGIGDILVPLVVMAGFGVAFTVMAAARFRLEDAKAYYG